MINLKLAKLATRRARRGATALEYALVLAFVAVAVLGALSLLGGNITTAITSVGSTVGDAVDSEFTAPPA